MKKVTIEKNIDWKIITEHINGSLIPVPYSCSKCNIPYSRLGYHFKQSFYTVGLICANCQTTILKDMVIYRDKGKKI